MNVMKMERINKVVADFVGATEGVALWQEIDQLKHSELVDVIYQMAKYIVEEESTNTVGE